MSVSSSRRFGMPSSAPREVQRGSSSPRTSSTSSQASSIYSQFRPRPITHRVQSAETAVSGEDKGIRVSLDTMGGNSVETVMNYQKQQQLPSKHPQRARPVRSFTSPMQFKSDAVQFPATTTMKKSTLEDQRLAREQIVDEEEEQEGEEESDAEAGPEEFVVALHDFTSSNETCLSFESGQVIKVFNRDESGWWDGELNGQRGWFPSNYVDEDGITSNADGQSSDDFSSPRGSMDHLDSSEGDHHYRQQAQTSMKSSSKTPTWSQSHSLSPAATTATSSSSGGSHQTYTRTMALSSRTPTPTLNTIAAVSAVSTSASVTHTNGNSVLDPIFHATSLLHNAVRANRVAHFQPSTACVISSVRSVLSATDCLTRESNVLKAHPILAKERKQILAELSKLVTQARIASAPTVEPFKRDWEMDEMLNIADTVLKNVKRFLDVAIECGVAVPDRRSSIYDEMCEEKQKEMVSSRNTLYATTSLDRSESDKTPTPESPRTSTYRNGYNSVAYSASEEKTLNALHELRIPRATTMPAQTTLVKSIVLGDNRLRSDSLQSEIQDSSSCDHSQTGSNSISGSGSASAFGSGSSHSESCDSLEGEQQQQQQQQQQKRNANVSLHAANLLKPLLYTPANVLGRVQHANDQLLSTIAAFIGHIHSHTRNSHASSYAFLIDMTRATVDGVRNLLVIVEAIHENTTLRLECARAMSILWETRESVYEATASLVTAARIITSSSITTTTTTSNTPIFASEEDEKAKLLQTATAVLRTGGECVGAVRLCLNRASPTMKISIMALSQQYPPSTTSQSQDQQQQNNQLQDQHQTVEQQQDEKVEEGNQVVVGATGLRRGKHTLSLLGRKATSLSCLREQYEVDDGEDGSAAFTQFEPIEEDEEEIIQGTIRVKRGRMPLNMMRSEEGKAVATLVHGDTDDSSEPMSRDHSQTSEYTFHSDSTADTSARPSIDRSLTASVEDRLPHSAPLLGSFPRQDSSEGILPTVRNRSTSLASTGSRSSPPADHIDADVCFNSEGQLTGATLTVLVERMTPHDTTVDATFSTTFFLCFRLFTTPMELFAALESRYHLQAPQHIQLDAEAFTKWSDTRVAPIRLRIFNFFKMWLETHWNPVSDYDILERLINFCRNSMTYSLNKPGQRLADLAVKKQMAGRVPKQLHPSTVPFATGVASTAMSRGGSLQRMMSTDRIKMGPSGNTDVNGIYAINNNGNNKAGLTAPAPILSKGLMAALKSSNKVTILDFDPMELARQLTIIGSRTYCNILPEELLGGEFSKKAGISNSLNVKAMSSFSNQITGWISECILSEEDARKRTQIVKYCIKLGDRCMSMKNYDGLMAIQCALTSTTINRLRKTWDGLPAKYNQMMADQAVPTQCTRNFADYRQILRTTIAPALPFVGLFLTDLTFCDQGNASTRPSPVNPTKKLLNFDKYVKMSRIIGELQRFQIPYNLVEVPEIQSYLYNTFNEVSNGGKADDLYRRSLLLEPRGHNDYSPATITGRGLGSDSKLGLDLFNWK